MRVIHVQKIKGIAGSEKGFLNLLPGLVEHDISVMLLCFYEKKHRSAALSFIGQVQVKNIEVKAVQLNYFFSALWAAKKIKSFSKQWNADMIHSHLIHSDFWCALSKSIFRVKSRIVSTKHGYDEDYLALHGFEVKKSIRRTLYWNIARFSEKRITASFAVSKGLSKFYSESGITQIDEIPVIYHGLDFDENLVIKKELKFGTPQLIIVGRLVSFKGHKYVFEHLAKLKQAFPSFSLVILGDGPMRSELTSIAESQGCKFNVRFQGYQPNITEYLAVSDIKLVPSIAEGFGLVSLEAMNQELAIVGFNVSAINEIVVHEETGLLIEPFNGELFSKDLISLLKKPEMYAQMGRLGKERLSSNFSVEGMVKNVIEFYRKNN
jgi:glycosyltransferase involved in cell wall biosynthesis